MAVPDIRALLNAKAGRNAAVVAQAHGRAAVRTEISEMIENDLADVAMTAALALGEQRLASRAAREVLCSGGYPDEAKRVAARTNRDLDIAYLREKWLKPEGGEAMVLDESQKREVALVVIRQRVEAVLDEAIRELKAELMGNANGDSVIGLGVDQIVDEAVVAFAGPFGRKGD